MNMMDCPRVSVLLPVRNGMPWVGKAVASILEQTFQEFELIVLEDGSTDGTPALLEKIRDPRMLVASTGGVGIARALNTGLDIARGGYIARQDADDESLPERLARQVALLETRPDIAVVATVAEYIDSAGRAVDNAWVQTVRRQQDAALTPDAIRDLMPLTCCVTHGSILARAEVLRAAGGYTPEMVPAEDYELWLRLLPANGFAKIADPLYRHRLHESQSGARARQEQTRLTVLAKMQYLRRACPYLPMPARLALTGCTRGDDYYRMTAAEAGFVVTEPAAVDGLHISGALPGSPPLEPPFDWDVLAVTDFSALRAYERQLQRKGGPATDRIGNFFVPYAGPRRRVA